MYFLTRYRKQIGNSSSFICCFIFCCRCSCCCCCCCCCFGFNFSSEGEQETGTGSSGLTLSRLFVPSKQCAYRLSESSCPISFSISYDIGQDRCGEMILLRNELVDEFVAVYFRFHYKHMYLSLCVSKLVLQSNI